MKSHNLPALLLGLWMGLSSAIAAPSWLPGHRVRLGLEVMGGEELWKDGGGWVVASLPTGGLVRPGGGDIQVQGPSGRPLVTQIISSNPTGDTIIQFQREGESRQYWAYLGYQIGTSPPAPLGQALTLEVRPFQANSLDSWAEVLKELQETPTIQGNALVVNAAHSGNPFRPDRTGGFVAIYRGHLKIDRPGTYLLSSNSDDASFLFINRQLVYSQTGRRSAAATRIPDWYEAKLPAGLVPIEFYHFASPQNARGQGRLMWKAPDQKKWSTIPSSAFVQAPIAEVTGIEGAPHPAATFSWGMEDALVSSTARAFLVRFQAHGNVMQPEELRWNFGDGTTATGASVQHVYFDKGDYQVTLQAGVQPPGRQSIYVYEPPVNSSPLALRQISLALEKADPGSWDDERLNRAFDWTMASEQPDRWKFQQRLAEMLLARPGTGGARQMVLYDVLLEALARQGKAEEAVKLKEPMFAAAGRSGGLRLEAGRSLARIQWKYLRHFNEASELYETVIEENRRMRLPELRRAAIEWGDLFLEAGELNQAEERYRLAATLGGDEFTSTGQMQAIQRGALLRVAEQQLRAGNYRQSRALLDRIEMEQPEQKLEGLFRFLRAEVDRQSGRYVESVRNYEVLLRLPQWSGYRDRALSGIARCYFQLGETAKAREIFEVIQKTYPAFFEEQQLGKLFEATGPTAVPVPATAKGEWTVSLEAGRLPATLQNLTPMNGLGIFGNRVLEAAPAAAVNTDLQESTDALLPGERSWFEFWYREQRGGFSMTADLSISPTKETSSPQRIALDRTFGRWRKAGILLPAPSASPATVRFRVLNLTGFSQWDGLRVFSVSAAQLDSLKNFLQEESAP